MSRPPTCGGAEGRAKGSASGLRWELRGNTGGGEGGSEGSRIPCGPSRGGQGRGWEQRPRGRGKVLGGQKELLGACQAASLALASSPVPDGIWLCSRALSVPGGALVAAVPAEPRGCGRAAWRPCGAFPAPRGPASGLQQSGGRPGPCRLLVSRPRSPRGASTHLPRALPASRPGGSGLQLPGALSKPKLELLQCLAPFWLFSCSSVDACTAW